MNRGKILFFFFLSYLKKRLIEEQAESSKSLGIPNVKSKSGSREPAILNKGLFAF